MHIGDFVTGGKDVLGESIRACSACARTLGSKSLSLSIRLVLSSLLMGISF